MKKIAAFILFIGVLDSISAQSTLTLDTVSYTHLTLPTSDLV